MLYVYTYIYIGVYCFYTEITFHLGKNAFRNASAPFKKNPESQSWNTSNVILLLHARQAGICFLPAMCLDILANRHDVLMWTVHSMKTWYNILQYAAICILHQKPIVHCPLGHHADQLFVARRIFEKLDGPKPEVFPSVTRWFFFWVRNVWACSFCTICI